MQYGNDEVRKRNEVRAEQDWATSKKQAKQNNNQALIQITVYNERWLP